jgi:hypothetical protein
VSSLYEGKDAIRRLKKMKKSLSLDAPPSNQKATAPSSSRPTESRPKQKATVNSKAPMEHIQQVEDDYGHFEEEDHFEGTVEPRPTQEYVDTWKALSNDKNKENRPVNESANPTAKRRYVDRQPNARRVDWDEDSQEANGGPSNRKRSHEEREETEESEESADLGFEQDRRVPDPARRVMPPPEPPAKRHRAQSTPLDEDEAASRRSQERAEEQLQTEARRERERRAAEVEDEDEFYEEEDEEEAQILFSQVASTASVNTQKVRIATAQTQKRTPWSEADSQRLIDLIDQHGCSWSFIQKRGGFQVDRDQVALKDKARNLKVMFVK